MLDLSAVSLVVSRARGGDEEAQALLPVVTEELLRHLYSTYSALERAHEDLDLISRGCKGCGEERAA